MKALPCKSVQKNTIIKLLSCFTGRTISILIFIIATCLSMGFSSCRNNQKEDAVKTVAAWIGKEIRFPEGIAATSMGKDTTGIDLYGDNYKIILYVDSLGCTSCRLKLAEWKKIMNESDSIFDCKPAFLFFFQPKQEDERELAFLFRQHAFHHPVFIDRENQINRLNNFPSKPEHQCFLLDKDNKVVLVGNPSLSSGIWTLYQKVIREREINR